MRHVCIKGLCECWSRVYKIENQRHMPVSKGYVSVGVEYITENQ